MLRGAADPAAGTQPSWWGRLSALRALPYRVRLAASLTGYLITAAVIIGIYLNFPGFGHDVAIWDRVGDDVRAGVSPYGGGLDQNLLFFYSPVWAVIFAAVSWLPREAVIGGLMVIEILALRYCAGSWLRVGYVGLIPIIGFELSVGQINLIIAAAVAAALRGDGRLAVVAAFAKLSPVLAITDLKRPFLVALACLLVTLPVLHLWGDWLNTLITASDTLAPAPLPYAVRVGVAAALLVVRRPWARGLAVIIAIPNPTPNTYALLAALLPAVPASRTRDTVDGTHRPAILVP